MSIRQSAWDVLIATGIVALAVASGCANRGQMRSSAQPPLSPDVGSPGPQHRFLDRLTGRWEVRVRFPAGAGETREGRSSCEAWWTLDGRFVRLEYTSIFAGKPLTVVRYVGFDRFAGEVVEVQFESTRTDVLVCRGRFTADGSAASTVGTHYDPSVGKQVVVRSTTTWPREDAFTLQLIYGEGDDERAIWLDHHKVDQP